MRQRRQAINQIKKHTLSFVILSVTFLALGEPSWGQGSPSSPNPLMSPEELKTLEKARKRSYPGGRDEESLKVQAQLVVPSRKMSPATEAPTESGAASAPSPSDD